MKGTDKGGQKETDTRWKMIYVTDEQVEVFEEGKEREAQDKWTDAKHSRGKWWSGGALGTGKVCNMYRVKGLFNQAISPFHHNSIAMPYPVDLPYNKTETQSIAPNYAGPN